MLKKVRVVFAAFFLIALTLLSLDFTGAVHAYVGWCAKVQFVPAVLTLNVLVLAALVAVTLVFGRIYCSAVCPLGIFQDVVSRVAGVVKKNRFSYRPPKKALVALRFGILGIFIVALVAHIVAVSVNLEPYSVYGRMVSQIFAPLYLLGNNILAYFAERAGSYAFYRVDIFLNSVAVLVGAIVSFVVIAVFAVKSGRGYCNTICPVGTLLAVITKFSFVQPPISKDTCNGCNLCAKNCKAGCIDTVNKEIDYLRCVSCCNCIEVCPKKAISFKLGSPMKKSSGAKAMPVSSGDKKVLSADTKSSDTQKDLAADNLARRGLLAGIAVVIAGLVTRVSARQFDGGLAALEDKKAPARAKPILPPGSDGARHHRAHCTACQLCVTVCANNVLRPSGNVSTFMQPHLTFERGYCRPECVKCSQVCPTGAIRPITAAEKSSIQTGIAVWKSDLCVVNTDKVICDLCARKCPTGAIKMIAQSADDASSPKIPMIDTARCIGCGACENLCPSRPYSAIYVDGVDVHRNI